MDTSTPARLQRIQRVSRWVRSAYILLITVCAIIVLWHLTLLWTETGFGVIAGRVSYQIHLNDALNTTNIRLSEFSTIAKILYTLGSVLPVWFYCKGFYHLYRLFYYYAQGSIFTNEANGQIRKFGVTGVLLAVFSFPCYELIVNAFSLAMTKGNALTININPYQHALALIIPLIVGLSAICISLVMDAGIEMNEDHELTI